MNHVTIGLGIASIAYGLVTLFLRATRPHLFRKLQPMKAFWGEKAGVWVHFIGYSLMPVIFGIFLISKGMRGESLF